MAGIDITTDAPLKNTIKYIGELVDELETLTEEIEARNYVTGRACALSSFFVCGGRLREKCDDVRDFYPK